MGWGSSIFPLLIITSSGGFTGLFVYSPGPGPGKLIASIAAQAGTDPFGNAFPAGFATYNSHGKVVNLLSTAKNAFFQFNDSGAVQGPLILSVASVASTDPVSATPYPAGMYGIDPVFGDTIQTVGANINMNQVSYTRPAAVVALTPPDNAHNPLLVVNAPEQTTASHMQLQLQGASPDGTRLAQFLVGAVSGATNLTPASQSMAEVQGGTGQQVTNFIADAAATRAIGAQVTGDTNQRWTMRADGLQAWGSGAAGTDCSEQRLSANRLGFVTCDVAVHTAGRGLQVAEGSNAKQGTATLAGGTVVVANTSVTASSRIFLTAQDNNSTGALRVSARTAGTSFTVTSSNAGDTGVVGWEIFEPG